MAACTDATQNISTAVELIVRKSQNLYLSSLLLCYSPLCLRTNLLDFFAASVAQIQHFISILQTRALLTSPAYHFPKI